MAAKDFVARVELGAYLNSPGPDAWVLRVIDESDEGRISLEVKLTHEEFSKIMANRSVKVSKTATRYTKEE